MSNDAAIYDQAVYDPAALPTTGAPGRLLAGTVLALLAAISLLLPLERGFPYIRLGPVPFTASVFLALATFIPLALARPLKTYRDLLHPPIFWNILFTIVLLVRSVFSHDPNHGIATSILYGATWVAQFAVMLSLLEWLGRPRFARIYCAVAAIAAILGILEGLFNIVLPPYQAVRVLYAVGQGYLDASGGRVDGPAGNSILFAFQMVLSIPFAFEIKSRPLRWGLAVLFALALSLTIARIGYLMLAVLIFGALLGGGRAARATLAALSVGALVVVVAATVFSSNPAVERIGDRFFGSGAETSAGNVRFRQQAIQSVVTKMTQDDRFDILIWGEGVHEGDRIGSTVFASVTTIDNAYITIFYETGLAGAILFFAAHAFHIRRLWGRYGPARLYWFAAVAGLSGGIAFVSVYTSVANFPFVAILAILSHEFRLRRKIERAGRLTPYAPPETPRTAVVAPAGAAPAPDATP